MVEPKTDLTIKRTLVKKLYQNNKNDKNISDQINILFVLDITGSMEKYRDLLVNSVDLISEKLAKINRPAEFSAPSLQNTLNIKFGSIAYRDICDGDIQFEIQAFTTDKQKFAENIKNLKCDGGGDACEDIKGAIQKALTMEWNSLYKFLVLITDAPAHGNKYHEANAGDDYGSDAKYNDMTVELKQMADKEIVFIGIKFTDCVERMYTEIEAVYATNHGKFSLINDKDLKNIQASSACSMNIINIFAQRISEPIFSDFSENSIKKALHQKGVSAVYYGCKNKEKWQKEIDKKFGIEAFIDRNYDVHLISCDMKFLDYSNIYNLPIKTPKYNEWKCGITSSPQLQGSFRQIYLLRVYKENNDKDYHKYLAKSPKGKPWYNNMKEIIEEWRGSLIARHMAKLFREETYEKCKTKTEFDVMFNDVFIIKAKDAEIYYAVEKVIEGPFTKYNNNLGWVADFPKVQAENLIDNKWEFQSFNLVAQAFSHYTFKKSLGNCLVCDLQGVIQNLTDPLVLTKKSNDNPTNTSSLGIAAFFQTHKCNHICKELELVNIETKLSEDVLMYIEKLKKNNNMNKTQTTIYEEEEQKVEASKYGTFRNKFQDYEYAKFEKELDNLIKKI